VRRQFIDALTVEPNLAGVGFEDAANQIECGGLASPVWPDQGGNRSLFDGEGAVLHGLNAAKRFV
jgi:hypothetical protein